uniref:tRNA (guanine(9)-N(1))-methyltransferase n=2 Tax=Tetraselmis sp. GSL018 TaxID=582737 RepID=A0A061RBJ9_9CHLO|eukprot:CAMPEP_0177594812 /NCGR_PEP_ID=MMETSP0419_2-20121207/9990_1 /TAXON_ID=582737 /ORGANISM="Tetraselmis sp., Strain GSL018" /LENGTH=543 /DNA_ID=CAMNT_0019086165 /DNA_START=104 /DNA_END=1735 /DNA_ORIENTATION=+
MQLSRDEPTDTREVVLQQPNSETRTGVEDEEDKPDKFLGHVDSAQLIREHPPHHSDAEPPVFKAGQRVATPPIEANGDSASRPPAHPEIRRCLLHHVDSAELIRQRPPRPRQSSPAPVVFQVGGSASHGAADAGSAPGPETPPCEDAVESQKHEQGSAGDCGSEDAGEAGSGRRVDPGAGMLERPQAECGEEAASPGDGPSGGAPSEAAPQEGGAAAPLSKRQQKKLLKQQRIQDKKAARKQQEKEAKEAAKAQRQAEREQELSALAPEERERMREEAKAKRAQRQEEAKEKRARLEEAMRSGQRVVVDLDFEELMADSDIRSLCQQLAYSYSANCRAARPFSLHLSSVKGKVGQFLRHQVSGLDNWLATKDSATYLESFGDRKGDLVYLTADSPNVLSELDASKIYIIGGLVDRNKHKGLCQRKAEKEGIATASLPIGPHLHLVSSKVLTVNHVVEILLQYAECQDWREALLKVIPQRKRGGEDSDGQEPRLSKKQRRRGKQAGGGGAGAEEHSQGAAEEEADTDGACDGEGSAAAATAVDA